MPDLTPNINLKKPLLNEAANIEVINDNMDKIDSEIAKIRDSAKREHLADLFTNGIIPNALKELKITQTDTPSKAIKIETGKINIDGIVYTFSESTTLNIEPSDALDVTNEPHTSNTGCKLKLTYFPLANQAGDGLATKSDITVTRVSDGSVVNVISINAQTGEVTTDTPNESLQVDYKSFSKRIDIVYLDTYDGTLKVLKGTPVLPTFNPNIPNLKEETFGLGKINLSPDFNAVVDNMIKSDRVFYNINGIEDNFNEVDTRMAEFAKEIENHIGSRGDSHGLATTSSHGFMSNVDKIRLDSTLTSTSDIYITGTYTGDGRHSQFINVGFRPSAVIVTSENGDMGVYPGNSGGYEGYGGLALNGHPIVCASINVIKISTNGFYAYYLHDSSNSYIHANANGTRFHYIAFK
ncbi:MAG: DUF4815 domain-containing protein [Maledivibacter sp.]|nr:DUF4815 domain-containing protein [Maledivibacter sp.]